MEINDYKQPEFTKLIESLYKSESPRYDVKANTGHLTVTEANGANPKNINYEDLHPEKVYALRTTTTDIQTGKQETSFSLFLDRKQAETHFFQQTPKDNLIMNHQVQHGIIIEGDANNRLLSQLQMSPKDFNEMLVVSSLQTQSNYADALKQQVEQASKVAERIYGDIHLSHENTYNTMPKGAQQDLYKYYELTHGENRQISHVDAYAIQEKKEAAFDLQREPYSYVGMIHSKDHSMPSVAYTSEHEYLHAIEQGLKNNPQNLGYETISKDPQLHKQVDDLVYKFYGLSNPNPIESYTEQGRQTISLNEANNHQISIMDLAKEMGFTYRNTNGQGDIIMQKIDQPNENKPQITQIDLIIENAENPLKNTVTVTYSSFNDSKSMVQGPNFNPIAQDSDFHLSFNEFVALTKPLNSEEAITKIQSSKEQSQQFNVRTESVESLKNTTDSIYRHDELLYDLQDKFKFDFSTLSKFANFMESAHPADNKQNLDIVVFPYVKVDNQYNLEGHQQATLSSQSLLDGKPNINNTNAPIGYERYTQDQTIPVKPYTTNAAIEGGVWMATEAQKPNQVKDIFMFNSAVDAMSFYELHKKDIDLKNTALVSVGNLARENQIYGVVERFPEAKLHTAFQNTLLGELSTITTVSLATIGPVKFKTDDTKNTVEFTTYNDKFSMPIKDISLQNFKEQAHITDKGLFQDLEKNLKIHSPNGRSYNEDLVQSKSEKQEQNRTLKL